MATRAGSEGGGTPRAPRTQAAAAKQRFEALHHPWRTRILEVLNERSMSVSQFVDEGLIEDLVGRPRSRAIPALAYHFRALRDAGAIEIIEQNPRRGTTELVCRACARAHVSDEEWAALTPHQRQAVSRVMLSSLIARAESAVHHDSFDSRHDRHLAWMAMEIDEQGWSQLAALLNGVLASVDEINREARARLRESGERPIRTTWGQLHFESPPLPAPPASD